MKRKYKVTLPDKKERGVAILTMGYSDQPNAPVGYLWIGDENEKCFGWLNESQLDAIARQWLKRRAMRGVR